MFELARYESRRRIKGAVYLTVGFTLFAMMYVATYPSVASDIDLDQFIDQMPDIFKELFNLATLNTMEGFLAVELYSLGWTLLLGMYVAYSAATLIAEDVDRERMDILLSLPISRSQVVGEKFCSLLVPIVLVNLAMPVVVYIGTIAVGFPVDPVNLVVVHLLSVPYLLACAGIGMALSVLVSRSTIAQRGALVLIFALFLFESLVVVAGYEWLGAIAPMRYYNPTAVLVEGSYDWQGALIALAGAAVLLGVSALYFTRRDIE